MQMTQYETLKTQLAQNSPEELAALIAELSATEDAVYQAAIVFVQRKEPKKLLQTLRSQLRSLRTGKTFYTYRNARVFHNKLAAFLDSIERNLRPKAPLLALDLLGQFFEADAALFERADDSDGMIGDAFRRAAELFADIADSQEFPPEAEAWFHRLLQKNDYGVRDRLLDNASRILAPLTLEKFIQTKRTMLEERPPASGNNPRDYSRHELRVQIMQLAKASNNIELFAEIALEGRPCKESPAYSIEIAKHYLENGKAEKALEYLPDFDAPAWNASADRLRLQALESLGRKDEANAKRLENVSAYPSASAVSDYLKNVAATDLESTKARLRTIILESSSSPMTRADGLTALGNTADAADTIWQNAAAIQQGSYYAQSDLAKKLDPQEPLAATLLYRGAAEQTLDEAKPKNYRYAVNYLKKLQALEVLIKDWKGQEAHAAWWTRIHAKHDRKTSLTRELKKAGIGTTP
ncbi:MAG: hypothetical protein ACI9ZV_000283 [Candidatus Azotimanducaceae bacterium]|jgi:hypothetical protein